MREKRGHCPRWDSNPYLWNTRQSFLRLHHDGRHACRRSKQTIQTLTRELDRETIMHETLQLLSAGPRRRSSARTSTESDEACQMCVFLCVCVVCVSLCCFVYVCLCISERMGVITDAFLSADTSMETNRVFLYIFRCRSLPNNQLSNLDAGAFSSLKELERLYVSSYSFGQVVKKQCKI